MNDVENLTKLYEISLKTGNFENLSELLNTIELKKSEIQLRCEDINKNI